MAFGDLKGTLTGAGLSVTNPSTATGSVAVNIGDLIVVMVAEIVANSVSAVTANAGGAAALAAVNAGTLSTVAGRLFYKTATAAGTITSISCTMTASADDYAIVAAVFEGPFLSSPLDRAPANTTDAVTPFTCAATTVLSQPDELIVAGLALTRGQTATTATAPLLLAVNAASAAANTASSVSASIGRQVVSATATQTPVFASTGTINGAVQIVATFKKDAGATGTLAVTQAAQIVSATGGSQVTGALSSTQSTQIISATGGPRVTGALSSTQSTQIISASGGPQVAGSLSSTQSAQILSATGEPRVGGTLSVVQNSDSLVSSGRVVVSGTLSVVETNDLLAASAGLQVTGTLAVTQIAQAVVAAGGLQVTGALGVVQAAQGLVAAGGLQVTGTLEVFQAAQGLVGSGDTAAGGVLAVIQAAQILVAAGNTRVDGTFVVTEADDALVATGTIEFPAVVGTLNVTQAPQALVASGRADAQATLSVVQQSHILFAEGSVIDAATIDGVLSIIQADNDIVAAGSVTGTVGYLDLTQESDALVSAANAAADLTLIITQSDQILDGTGGSRVDGAVETLQEEHTISATGTVFIEIRGNLNLTEESDTLVAKGGSVHVVGQLSIIGYPSLTVSLIGDPGFSPSLSTGTDPPARSTKRQNKPGLSGSVGVP